MTITPGARAPDDARAKMAAAAEIAVTDAAARTARVAQIHHQLAEHTARRIRILEGNSDVLPHY